MTAAVDADIFNLPVIIGMMLVMVSFSVNDKILIEKSLRGTHRWMDK